MKPFKAIKAILLSLVFLPIMLQAQETSQVIETESFSALSAGSIFKIELTQGETHFVEIVTEEKFMDNVEVNVKNGVLHLDFKGSARNASISATIISPEINSIKLDGASSLRAMNEIQSEALEITLSGASSATLAVNTSSLETKASGASSLSLSGNATFHKSTTSGASQLKAQQLSTQTTHITSSGASHARVNASDFLDATASGTSKISYDTEPVSQQIKTSGMASVNGLTSNSNTSSTYEPGDTTRIKLGNRDLWIIDEENDEKIQIKKRDRSFRNNWAGFELGINGYLTPNNDFNFQGDAELIDLRYEKSIIVNINFFQQSFPIIRNNLGLFTGVGLSVNNYRFDNQTRIVHNREGLEFLEVEDKLRKNKLTLTYITVPLMLEFQTGGKKEMEKFHLAGGMILGTRIGSHAKYVYDDNGKKRKEKDFNNFHVPPFRFDLSGRIGWGRINLFATYSLNSLFLADKGPELYPFSVGIRLVNW